MTNGFGWRLCMILLFGLYAVGFGSAAAASDDGGWVVSNSPPDAPLEAVPGAQPEKGVSDHHPVRTFDGESPPLREGMSMFFAKGRSESDVGMASGKDIVIQVHIKPEVDEKVPGNRTVSFPVRSIVLVLVGFFVADALILLFGKRALRGLG